MKILTYCLMLLTISGCIARSMHNLGMYEEYEDSPALLLHVISDDGDIYTATGFAIEQDTVLTVAHFCANAIDSALPDEGHNVFASAPKSNGRYATVKAHVVAYDLNKDICLILAPNHGANLVKLEDANNLKINDDVWVVGIPLGQHVTHSYGKVLSAKYKAPILDLEDRTASTYGRLIATTPVTFGMSGSPLFNADGKVVGICLMRLKNAYDNFAVFATLQEIYQFLYRLEK